MSNTIKGGALEFDIIAKKVIDNLSTQIEEKGIAVEISGDTKVLASEKTGESLIK